MNSSPLPKIYFSEGKRMRLQYQSKTYIEQLHVSRNSTRTLSNDRIQGPWNSAKHRQSKYSAHLFEGQYQAGTDCGKTRGTTDR